MQSSEDYKIIFTEVIKRQIAILGPDITLAKVKNVQGIQIDAEGQVTAIQGDPQVLLSELINQFVELSGLIVKKTMESILMSHPDGLAILGDQMSSPSGAGSVQPIPQASLDAARDKQGENAQVSQPQAPQMPPTQEEQEALAANKDIEDLNKMLNNIGNRD